MIIRTGSKGKRSAGNVVPSHTAFSPLPSPSSSLPSPLLRPFPFPLASLLRPGIPFPGLEEGRYWRVWHSWVGSKPYRRD